MNRAAVAKARALLAEVSALLEVIESELPHERAPKRRAVSMPEERARPEVVDQVRRGLRRRGVVA